MARMRARKPPQSHDVTVIADAQETVGGLVKYVCEAGLQTRGSRTLDVLELVEATRLAVVLFPDAFEPPDVVAMIRAIRTLRGDLLLVVVTEDVSRFYDVSGPSGRSTVPLRLPKPAFGWAILDAVRAHAAGGGRGGGGTCRA